MTARQLRESLINILFEKKHHCHLRRGLNPQFYTTQNLKIYKLVYCRQKCEI